MLVELSLFLWRLLPSILIRSCNCCFRSVYFHRKRHTLISLVDVVVLSSVSNVISNTQVLAAFALLCSNTFWFKLVVLNFCLFVQHILNMNINNNL